MRLGYGYRKKKNVRWLIKRKFMLHLASVRYILMLTEKMSDFRIFCELIAKMMLESIDFTDVLEGYRRNEKPEILGIATRYFTP